MSKNMIFRLGVDASDFTKKMKQAGILSATTSAQVQNAFSAKGITGIREVVAEMESARASILKATEGMDLSESLTDQIKHARAAKDQIIAEQAKLEKKLKETQAMPTSRTDLAVERQRVKIRLLREEITGLRGAYAAVSDELEALQNVSEGLGSRLSGYASQTGLQQMESEIDSLKSVLDELTAAEKEAANAAGDFGDKAASSGRKLSIVPGFLRNIRSSANGSNSSLEKMVRTIRNVSVVSFGLRLVKGIFGELGSIVRQYISENAALQAQVNGLKSALGQALAPAINVVTNALTMAMPYVVGFSNAVGSLITSLFGSGWTTVAADANTAATAIGAAGSAQKEFNRQLAGFDEITKLSAESAGGGGGGGVGGSGTSSSIPAVEAKTPTWLTDLTKQVEEAAATGDFSGIGKAVADAISKSVDNINLSPTSLGSKLSGWFNNGIATFEGFVVNFDWSGAGNAIATSLSDFFGGINWSGISNTAGRAIHGVGTAMLSATDDVVLSFSERFAQGYTQAVQSGSDLYAAIGAGIGNAFSPAATWLKDNIVAPFVGGLAGKDTRVEVTAEVKDVDTSRLSQYKIPTIADFTRSKYSLTPSATTFSSTANFTGARNNLNPSATIFGSTANFTGAKNNLNPSATIFSSTADITRAKKNLSASDTTIAATADVTSWKDNLGDKQLKFAADVTKGWRGNLEEHLGIGTITTKLKVDVPTVSVKWSNAPAPNGNASVLKPQYSVAYNELGAIFSKSTLLGHADGKWQIGGEAGREVLLNVDRHTWWMDLIADKVVARTGGGSLGEDQNITVNLVVDGKVLTSTVVRNVNAQARATGRNPLAAYI